MDIHLGNFLGQILAFAILFWILKKYAFGPLVGMMEKRQNQIEAQINSAETNRQEAEKLVKEQNEALQAARLEAHDIIEKAKASSVKQANDILESAKNESDRIKTQALQEIKLEKEKAVAEVRDQVASLSVLIASKMIEKELDANAQSKLIDDVMKQVGESL